MEPDHVTEPTSDWHVDWGRLLRTARQVAGLSLTALARETGLSKGYLSKLESGHLSAANPSRSTLAALARALPSFGPLAHTLQPSTRIGALTFARVAPQLPAVTPESEDPALPHPMRLGWRELELVIALLVSEQSAIPHPLTAIALARSVGRTPGDVRQTLEGLVQMGVFHMRPPMRPGGAPTYARADDFEARVGITRVGDALILAAALLAQAPTGRRSRQGGEDE